jgi:hypothetical protein
MDFAEPRSDLRAAPYACPKLHTEPYSSLLSSRSRGEREREISIGGARARLGFHHLRRPPARSGPEPRLLPPARPPANRSSRPIPGRPAPEAVRPRTNLFPAESPLRPRISLRIRILSVRVPPGTPRPPLASCPVLDVPKSTTIADLSYTYCPVLLVIQ